MGVCFKAPKTATENLAAARFIMRMLQGPKNSNIELGSSQVHNENASRPQKQQHRTWQVSQEQSQKRLETETFIEPKNCRVASRKHIFMMICEVE